MFINQNYLNSAINIKKKRWKINDKHKTILNYYFDNVTRFPSSIELNKLAQKFNVTSRRIQVFFQNKRQRSNASNASNVSNTTNKNNESPNKKSKKCTLTNEDYLDIIDVFTSNNNENYLEDEYNELIEHSELAEYNFAEYNFTECNNLTEEQIILNQFAKEEEQIVFLKLNLDESLIFKIYFLAFAFKKLFMSTFNYIDNLNLAYYHLQTLNNFQQDLMIKDLINVIIQIEFDKIIYENPHLNNNIAYHLALKSIFDIIESNKII